MLATVIVLLDFLTSAVDRLRMPTIGYQGVSWSEYGLQPMGDRTATFSPSLFRFESNATPPLQPPNSGSSEKSWSRPTVLHGSCEFGLN